MKQQTLLEELKKEFYAQRKKWIIKGGSCFVDWKNIWFWIQHKNNKALLKAERERVEKVIDEIDKAGGLKRKKTVIKEIKQALTKEV